MTDNTINIFRERIEKILEGSDISFNGNNPWDIQVYNPKLYARILSGGSLGFGEAYMDGWWECDQIDELFTRILSAQLQNNLKFNLQTIFALTRAYLSNQQNIKRTARAVHHHYDLGNDLFIAMLDKTLTYTCAYWKDAATVEQAQENKLAFVCKKLDLRAGQKILDIGCGWGSFMKYAVEKYNVSAVGITLSNEQLTLGREMCRGLPIEIRLQDYRELTGTFDHIVSIGMFEQVGYKNYKEYMRIARRCLKDDGLFLLHTIGGNKSATTLDPWLEKYIFPRAILPSISQIGNAIEGVFVMEDWHNFGAYYDKTLLAWYENFSMNWDRIKSGYDERFYRMWKYYLLSCAGTFRSRHNQLWQVVLSPNGVPGNYSAIR